MSTWDDLASLDLMPSLCAQGENTMMATEYRTSTNNQCNMSQNLIIQSRPPDPSPPLNAKSVTVYMK